VRSLLVSMLLLVFASGCASGPPKIAAGTPCTHCGMAVAGRRFACARVAGREIHAYDSIECLLAEDGKDAADWLSDYDSRTLHPADSMWVVRGSFPSPMGGGYAAFLDRRGADDVAAHTNGSVARLAAWQAERGRP
jgi:nitrous oxide reductase accessory protein NosL